MERKEYRELGLSRSLYISSSCCCSWSFKNVFGAHDSSLDYEPRPRRTRWNTPNTAHATAMVLRMKGETTRLTPWSNYWNTARSRTAILRRDGMNQSAYALISLTVRTDNHLQASFRTNHPIRFRTGEPVDKCCTSKLSMGGFCYSRLHPDFHSLYQCCISKLILEPIQRSNRVTSRPEAYLIS